MSETTPPDTTPATTPATDAFAPVSRRRATLINLTFQYAGVAFTVARGILVVPIYLHYINADLYGAWLASGNIISWLSLSQGGFSYLLRQQTAESYGSGDRERLGRIIGSGFAITAALSLLALLLGVVTSYFCAGLLHLTGADADQLTWSFFWAGVAMAMGLMAGGFHCVQQGLQRHGAIGTIVLIGEATSLIVSVVMVIAGWNLISIGFSFVVRETIDLVAIGFLVRRSARQLKIPLRCDFGTVRSMLGLTGWTFLSYAGEWVLKNCDAFLVAMFLGNRFATITELSKRAWEILNVALSRLTFSFQPGLAHVWGGQDARKFREVVEKLLMVLEAGIGIGAGVTLALNEPFVAKWVGADKFAGYWYNELWALAATYNILTFSLGQILIAANNIRGSAIAQSAGNLARLLFLVLLLLPGWLGWVTPEIGALAVPLSTLCAMFVGGPLLAREWRNSVGSGDVPLVRHLLRAVRAVLLAAGTAFLWRYLPLATTWPLLVAHGVGLTGLLVAFFLIADPDFRATGIRAANAAARRLRGRPDIR